MPQTVFGRVDIGRRRCDTKISKRDKHLRSADFFDVEKYPDISVVVTGAEAIGGETVDLRANLTVKGTTAPIPLQAKVAVLDDGACGSPPRPTSTARTSGSTATWSG